MIRPIKIITLSFLSICIITPLNHASSKNIKKDEKTKIQKLAVVHRWRTVQKKAKDTVVQIFSRVAKLNLLKPYETPKQENFTGTGFFIDSEGFICTSAHVVEESVGLFIQIPSLGKERLEIDLVSICPDRDLALLKVNEAGIKKIKETIGKIPFLPLGDSDKIYRSDEVIALGYPLGEESLKSTSGVISGKEGGKIQTSAPINPGNSGGPLLNLSGEAIGINTEIAEKAENVGYATTINEFKLIFPNMKKNKLVRKPLLGIYYTNATNSLISYLGNPKPGGCYISDILQGSLLDEAGIKNGDILYKINNYKLNIYGELSVPWSEEKISLNEYVSRLQIGDEVTIVVYRQGKKFETKVTIKIQKPTGVRKIYPGYEKIDYEIFGGMIVMQLSTNHIKQLSGNYPGLYAYYKANKSHKNILVITHIFSSSYLAISRTLTEGFIIKEVNNKKVGTLDQFRSAILSGVKNKLFVVKAKDTSKNGIDYMVVSIPLDTIITQEYKLSQAYKYPVSPLVEKINASF